MASMYIYGQPCSVWPFLSQSVDAVAIVVECGGCGAQIAILCPVRGIYLVCECQVLHEIEQQSWHSKDMAELFSIFFKFVSCARRPLFTNLMMILVSLVASHFHQTTKTRTTAVSGRHLAHELAGLYRFLAIVHQQVQGLAGCKTVNQVWQLACMLCLPWLWQVIRSSISNIRWSMINQWTTYIFQFNPVQAKTHIEQKQVSSVLVRPHALLWASCGCNVLVNDEP